MSDLSLYLHTGTTAIALQKLAPDEQPYVVAHLRNKLDAVPNEEIQKTLTTVVFELYQVSGQKPDLNDAFILVKEFQRALFLRYPAMSLDEVAIALRNGIYGDYGEFYGINAKSLIGFVKAYHQDPKRREAFKKFIDARLIPESTPMTDEQKERESKELANLTYTDVCNGMPVNFVPELLCKFLIKQKLMSETPEMRAVYYEQAARYYNEQVTKETGGMPIQGYSYSGPGINPETTVRNIAKKFAVYDFFMSCKDAGLTKIFEL